MLRFLSFLALLPLFVSCQSSNLDPDTTFERIPTRGLLAFYSFDGHVVNQVSDDANSVIYGTSFIEDRFDREGKALGFDGIDDYVELSEANVLQAPMPMSFSLWIRLDQVEGTTAVLTTSYDEVQNAGIFVSFSSNGGKPTFSVGNGGRPGFHSRRTLQAAEDLRPDKWYHIVGVIEGALDMKVYVDGQQSYGGYDGGGSKLAYAPGPVTLGRRVAHAERPPIYFKGALDELAIYNVALSPKEVRGLYEAAQVR